jgi:glucose/mannose transport system substrate-binding protein
MVVLAGLLSANPGAVAEPRPVDEALILHHAWSSPSETAALDALVDLFKKTYPDVKVRTAAAEGRGTLFTLVREGRSDSFATQAGSTLQPFLDAGLVEPVDDVWAAEELDEVIPPALQKLDQREGHRYSLPIAIHRNNLLWYNKALLDKHHIDPVTLTTWEAFFKAADGLRAAGVARPIQMGVTWTATAVFEGIMAGQGRAPYDDWIHGRIRSPQDPGTVAAFTVFRKYLDYVNDDHARSGWDAAVKRVISGDAAFVVMGDWAEAEFQAGGLKYGKDYGAVPVPGTHGLYGMIVDSFTRPRRRPHDRNADRWLRVLSSREGQDAFNSRKGSVSARTDADVAKYGPYQRSALADLKAARLVYPSHDIVAPEAFKVRQTEVMAAFTKDRDVVKAAAALAAAAVQLEKHFKDSARP